MLLSVLLYAMKVSMLKYYCLEDGFNEVYLLCPYSRYSLGAWWCVPSSTGRSSSYNPHAATILLPGTVSHVTNSLSLDFIHIIAN